MATKRYLLRSEIERVKAKHPPFELVLPAVGKSGDEDHYPEKTLKIPAAQNMADDVLELSATNPAAAARILLGSDFPHYKAAGGTSALLFQIIQEHAGADLGE